MAGAHIDAGQAADAAPARDQDTEGALGLARQLCHQVFAAALAAPGSRAWARLRDSGFREAAAAAAAVLGAAPDLAPGGLAPGEQAPDRLAMADLLAAAASEDRIAAEHRRVFGFLLPKDCPPYETEYCPQTFSVYRSQRMADVAGYYRAFGLEPSRRDPERPDHLALELEFMAWLIAKERHARAAGAEAAERVAVCTEAQVSFFRDHVCWWAPAFAAALRRKAVGAAAPDEAAPPSFYGCLAVALAAFVGWERRYLGIAPPTILAAPTPVAAPPCEGCG